MHQGRDAKSRKYRYHRRARPRPLMLRPNWVAHGPVARKRPHEILILMNNMTMQTHRSTEMTRRDFVGATLTGAVASIAPPISALSQGSEREVHDTGPVFKDFEPWLASVMAEWKVPGVA